MSTGYTRIIEDNPNTTFRDYALRCARAFGACAHQRDQSLEAEPRPPEVVGDDAVVEHQAKIDEWESMSDDDLRARFQSEISRITKENEKAAREHAKKQHRYARVRAEVVAWKPPTKDHERLKTFMLEQIDSCYQPDEKPRLAPLPESAEVYRKSQVSMRRRLLDYAKKDRERSVKNAEASKVWIDELVRSLPER